MTIQYRPEIDGLRALSVIAVVIYHAKFLFGDSTLMTGGYIGVDIFFVISGYLICKIILREALENRFSFSQFYARRARRILPALFVVMAVTLAYAWSIVLPKEMKELSGSALASLAFGSNIWFWLEDSYTAAPSLLKPLLHTWSLSVEEQFYLVFPVVLLVILKYKKALLPHFLLLTFFVSLGYAEYLSYRNNDANFFLIPSRAWELLAGSLLAINELNRGYKVPSAKMSLPAVEWAVKCMPTLGLAMIIGSFLVLDESTRHPSLITLVPVLGCVLVIHFTSSAHYPKAAENWAVKILSFRPVRYVGLISYSLYLWHYPVFAFSRIKGDFVGLNDKLEGIVISVALAVISYYLVEQPLRSPKRVGPRVFTSVMTLSFAALVGASAYIYSTNGASFRVPSNITDVVDFNYWSDEKKVTVFSQHKGCWLTVDTYDIDDPFKICRDAEQVKDDLPTVFLIGDSHAGSLLPGLVTSMRGYANVRQRVKQGCLPIYERMRPYEQENNCYNAFHSAYEEAINSAPELILIAGRWRADDVDVIIEHLRALKLKTSSKIVLIGPLIYWQPELPRYLKTEIEKSPLEFPEMLEPDVNTFILDQTLAAALIQEQVDYFSVVNTLCDGARCKTRVNETPSGISAYDHDHLTEASSQFVFSKFRARLLSMLGVSEPLEP